MVMMTMKKMEDQEAEKLVKKMVGVRCKGHKNFGFKAVCHSW